MLATIHIFLTGYNVVRSLVLLNWHTDERRLVEAEMELLALVAALVVLDLAAARYGVDSGPVEPERTRQGG
jgi:hypothetical protein